MLDAGEMQASLTGNLDAKDIAGGDLDRLAPRADHGPATGGLHLEDAFLL